jgi:hypothetical protein
MNPETGIIDSQPGESGGHSHNICVTWAGTTLCGTRDARLVNFDPPPTTCLGSNTLCENVSFYFDLNIVSGYDVGLTASLLFCPTPGYMNGSKCVPAINEGVSNPLAVKLTWRPPGNAGPRAVLRVQQIGTSEDPSATCTKDGNVANATHILIEDTYGNQAMVPFNQTFCCSTACPSG